MRVKYFIEIIRQLLEKNVSQNEIAKALGFSKQNMTEILGKNPAKQRKNLKDHHLPALLDLCRAHKVGPQSADKLLSEIKKEAKG